MPELDVESVQAAELLYQIAERARGEATMWQAPGMRAELDYVAKQIEAAARWAITEKPVYGEAWAHAATLTLRKYTGLRKFIEHALTTPRSVGYIKLECRDGRHMACDTCKCWCHS